MDRAFSYILLFTASVLLQVYFFDNLTLSVYLSPLVYIAFLALLPMETPRGAELFLGLALGLAVDWTMGTAGINTAATLISAFTRRTVLTLTCGKETVRDGGIPSPLRLGRAVFLRYALLLVALHHACFFLLESLSAALLLHTAVRFLVSTVVTTGYLWIAAQLFTAKNVSHS